MQPFHKIAGAPTEPGGFACLSGVRSMVMLPSFLVATAPAESAPVQHADASSAYTGIGVRL